MTYNNNIYDLIDRYLLGGLEGEELRHFEHRMQSDVAFRQEVEKQKELIDAINYHEEAVSMKAMMDEFHSSMSQENSGKGTKVIIKPPGKNNLIRFFINTAVAAVVAALVVVGTLYFMGWFDYNKNEYTLLKHKIDRISDSQESLFEAFLEEEKEESKPEALYSATGFAISPNGYILTNYHVVREVDSVFISRMENDSLIKHKVNLVHHDALLDLAILKVSDTNFSGFGKLPYIFRQEYSELGEKVYTLGFSKKDVVYGEGTINSLTGYLDDTLAYQVSIPLNPGNSGGPLLDAKGNIIGIITGKHTRQEGAAFAIKSGYLKTAVDSMELDSLTPPPMLPGENKLSWKKQTQQIKDILPFIFKVEVFKEE